MSSPKQTLMAWSRLRRKKHGPLWPQGAPRRDSHQVTNNEGTSRTLDQSAPRVGLEPVRSLRVSRESPELPLLSLCPPPDKYGDIIREARQRIPLSKLGIGELRPKRAVTGALMLEIPGDRDGAKADALAGRLSEIVREKGVKITRPYKKAELRVRDLDESVTTEDITAAIAKEGDCCCDQIRMGEIKRRAGGLGTVWVQCPLTATKKITQKRRMYIGWLSCRVDALPPRRLQCYRYLEPGHTGASCGNPDTRSSCCFRCGQPGHKSNTCAVIPDCPACRKAGRDSRHKIGSTMCSAGQRGRKTGGEPGHPLATSHRHGIPLMAGRKSRRIHLDSIGKSRQPRVLGMNHSLPGIRGRPGEAPMEVEQLTTHDDSVGQEEATKRTQKWLP